MKKIWKLAVFGIWITTVFFAGKKMEGSFAAAEIMFPNLTEFLKGEDMQLPLTSKEHEDAGGTNFMTDAVSCLADPEVRKQLAEENRLSFETLLEEEENSLQTMPEESFALAYTEEQLKDFGFLTSRIYNVDGSTATSADQLNAEKLLAYDFHVDKNAKGPQILIYHTHSQEAFVDSIPGDERTSIVGMGDYLAQLLEQQGFEVLHHKEVFDMVDGVLDRNKAYTKAEPVIAKIIEENPSIQIVIDLHRDGVGENVHLVKEINGKPTAQMMFFNGLSYSAKNGPVAELQNPYLENNLALTMQMKLAADSMAPGFARKIYLKSLRFNLHLHPGAMLIEAGAQTNTVEEMRNGMEVLAQILGNVLY